MARAGREAGSRAFRPPQPAPRRLHAGLREHSNRRQHGAEVFGLPESVPLRVVRFVLEEGYAPLTAELVEPEGSLGDVLDGTGRRLDVRLATSLSGQRELRVRDRREVVLIKPNARRHWTGVSALEDADAVIVERDLGLIAAADRGLQSTASGTPRAGCSLRVVPCFAG